MKPTFNEKLVAFLALLSGLSISSVAVYYSVAGLAAIFAAAIVPIIIMGVALEVGKLVATVWLKQNWKTAPRLIKAYLWVSIVVLMGITSMGIFGFLSKAHLDQSVPTGEAVARISILDEKIKTQQENIETARNALRQLDQSVDQILARSTTEDGAARAAQLRRVQQKERATLQRDIVNAQTAIAKLNEEKAPIAKDLRKIEAEVGPIKYIAAFIYNQTPDNTMLEKAVTWVIILLVIVFDPLAVVLLLAAQTSFQQFKEREQLAEAEKSIIEDTSSTPDVTAATTSTSLNSDFVTFPLEEPESDIVTIKDDFDISKHPYLFVKPTSYTPPGVEPVGPQVYKEDPIVDTTPSKEELVVDATLSLDEILKLDKTADLVKDNEPVISVVTEPIPIVNTTPAPVVKVFPRVNNETNTSTVTKTTITPDEYYHISEEKRQEIVINKWVEDVKAGRVTMAEVPKNILLDVRGRI